MGLDVVTITRSSILTSTAEPVSRPAPSSLVTSTKPLRIVIVDRWPSITGSTSAITTVPRTATTAFGVLISTISPDFIFSLATAIAARPAARRTVAVPGISVIVSTERSRAVTVALPPSRTRTAEFSPVVIRS